MSTPPSDLPPPPPAQAPAPPPQTQIVGQHTGPPTTSVPTTPAVATTGGLNTLAVVSLVAAIGSFFAHVIPGIGGFTVALIAVVTGHMARNQIKRTGEQGMGLATAGLIIGYVHLALLVVGVVVVLLFIFVFGIAMFGISRH